MLAFPDLAFPSTKDRKFPLRIDKSIHSYACWATTYLQNARYDELAAAAGIFFPATFPLSDFDLHAAKIVLHCPMTMRSTQRKRIGNSVVMLRHDRIIGMRQTLRKKKKKKKSKMASP